MDKPEVGDVKSVLRKEGDYLVERHKIYTQGKWVDFNFTGSEIKQILSEVKNAELNMIFEDNNIKDKT